MSDRKKDLRFNGSGYYDPTAFEAVYEKKHSDKVKSLIKTLQAVAHLAGYEIVGRVVVRDKQTGEEYK